MRDKNINTKSIVEAGILSALIVVAMIANVYVPFFEFLGVVIIPLIVSVLYIRQDLKVSILSVAVSFILIFILSDISVAIMFILIDALPGITLGYCIKNKKSSTYSLFFTTMAYAIGIFLGVYVGNKLIYGGDMVKLIDEAVKTYNGKIKLILEQYKGFGMSQEKIDLLEKNIPHLTKELVFYSLPAYTIITAAIFSFVNYKVASSILQKLNIKAEKIKKFTQWHVNDKVAAIAIGLMAIGVIMDSKRIPGGGYIIYTSFILGRFIFVTLGVSLVVYLLRNKYKLKKTTVFLIILFTFMINVINIYFILGLVDSIINIRKFMDNFRGNSSI